MANIATELNVTANATSRLSALMFSLQESFARYALYRRTMRELHDLRDADLADIGLNRSMIKSVAHEAAYGSDA